jgi:hypothetical protein
MFIKYTSDEKKKYFGVMNCNRDKSGKMPFPGSSSSNSLFNDAFSASQTK